MCSSHNDPPLSKSYTSSGPPDWRNITLPAPDVLARLTDAHCHPTDLDLSPTDYDHVGIGALAAMATVPEDQDRVMALSASRPWATTANAQIAASPTCPEGPRVVACFGYHPWFSHRYSLLGDPPPKEEHYRSIFFSTGSKAPSTKNSQLFNMLLPYLPDPLPFHSLLDKLEIDIRRSLDQGRLTMLGEVGLDGQARLRWPSKARHIHDQMYPARESDRPTIYAPESQKELWNDMASSPAAEDEWSKLTPFKTSMNHQRAVLEAQLEIAIKLGVNVSFHSVASPGPAYDVLITLRTKHGKHFTDRVNVDIHSAGGWAPDFWAQAEKQLSNLYASPSILVTGRSASAEDLIRAISPGRILVESDCHDARLTTRLVWGACVWISTCKGWQLGEEGDTAKDITEKGHNHTDIVRQLEANWARFMRLM